MVQLSVIILNYKVPYYLMQCLQSVESALQDISSEIIVVDNNSEDQSCQWVKKYFPEVSLIQNKENVGFSKGNNLGVQLARGKFICLLNPDTVVSETVFKNALNFAEKNSNLGALGPKLIDGSGNFLPESKRNLPTPKVALQKLIGFQKNYYSNLNETETGPVQILVGAFMLMHKERYLEVGGLDEDYFMYGEDIDLSYKFLKAGYQNYYLGDESVLHYKGESTLKDEKYRKRFFGAMKIFYQKHFESNRLLTSSVGLALTLAKNLQSKPSTDNEKLPKEKTFFISEASIPEKLKEQFSNIKLIPISSITEIKNSLIIFDAEYLSYSEIIDAIQSLKNSGNNFRIKPRNFTFMLGSDSSTGRGEVLNLK